jgi:hypothetical protein
MTTILAVSVGDRIEQYGAYAGFASVLGLAVLSLLYFAQAREVKRLREWAGRAPERAAELEARVQSEAQKRVVAQPIAPAAPAAQSAATAATPAGQAGKTAPAGAPATAAAATQIIKPPAATPAGNGVPPKDGEGATATPAEGAEAKEGEAAKPGAPATEKPAAPAAGTPAAPAAGAPAAPAPATPAGATPPPGAKPAAPPAAPKPAPKPEPAVPLRVSQPTATVPPRGGARTPEPAGDHRSGRQILAVVAPAVVVLGFLVFIGVNVLGGDDEPTRPNEIVETVTDGAEPAPGEDDTTAPPASEPVDRGAVTVSVLNGTTVPGLARAVADKLVASKFTELGTVTNAADQTRSATIIEFVSGARDEALEVARVVKVGADAVQPMTEATRVIAGQGADVVVTVGADQNPGQ